MLADAAGRRLAVLRTQLSTSPRATASVSQQRTAATGSVWTDVPQVCQQAVSGLESRDWRQRLCFCDCVQERLDNCRYLYQLCSHL